MVPSGRQGQRQRPLNVPYQSSRQARPKRDRMEELRQCWSKPVGKFICLGVTVLLIAAILLIVYFTFWSRGNNPYGDVNFYQRKESSQQRNNAYSNSYRSNPSMTSQNSPNLQNLLNQPRSGDLSEFNRQNQGNNIDQKYQQAHFPSSNYLAGSNQQQQQPYGNTNQYNGKIDPQQQNSMQPYSYQYSSNQQGNIDANSQPLSRLLGQTNNDPKPPTNDPAYYKGPQVWPNAGFDPINLLAAQQQSGADGVGMRHPSSFMNNGMERQYGAGQGSNNADFQNRGALNG